jgi:hypothetical protein
MSIAESILKAHANRYEITDAAARKGGKDVVYTNGNRTVVMPDDSAIEITVGRFAANMIRARGATVAELAIALNQALPTPEEGKELYFWGGQSIRFSGGMWFVVA